MGWWLGKPFVNTSGAPRGSVFTLFLAHSPPGLCLYGTVAGSRKLAGTTVWGPLLDSALAWDINGGPLDSVFIAGVSGWEENSTEFSFAFLVVSLICLPPLGGWVYLVYAVSPECGFPIALPGGAFLLLCLTPGKPQLGLPGTSTLAVFVKAEVVHCSCPQGP